MTNLNKKIAVLTMSFLMTLSAFALETAVNVKSVKERGDKTIIKSELVVEGVVVAKSRTVVTENEDGTTTSKTVTRPK